MIRSALRWLTDRLSPPRVIYDRDGLSPYLSRWYLTASPTMPDGSSPFANGQPKPGVEWPTGNFGIYLHQFHRSDDDLALHNHPWRWALSFILVGGYREERRWGTQVIRRDVKPFSFNFIRGSDFHRVDLHERDAWSIFIVGPKISSWGFWDRHTGEFVEWREFITRKRGEGWQNARPGEA